MPSQTGIDCLRILIRNLRRDVNVDALLTPEFEAAYNEDAIKALFDLTNGLKFAPERVEDAMAAAATYVGPALLELKSKEWVLVQNLANLAHSSVVGLSDPGMKRGDALFHIPTDQVKERMSGRAVIFHKLDSVDNAKYSSTFCLSAIARHHGLAFDIRRLLHDYAVSEEDLDCRHLQEMATECGLKNRRVKMPWKKLLTLGGAFPAVGIRRDGRYAVLCGMRKDKGENDEVIDKVAIVDPEYTSTHPGQQFEFLTEAEYDERFSGDAVLMKRVYKLTDEEQPFGLRWFLPEFFKLKDVFGKVAIAVLLMTAITLITPLFFQVVVDKVLVHASFRTLNVLGIGIVVVIMFNAVMEYLRGYLLLFATNKIDIATALKTFSHLMHLPIEFFERMPSGVLLKHMQQTEKIRGFLSGNLFFTILELFSLIVFIPFLMLYSMWLTLVVMSFSLLMALVIAMLIKPFQRRLDELYQAEGKRQSRLVEAIHGVRTVKSLAIEPVEEKEWGNTTAQAVKAMFRVGQISLTARSISQMLEMLMNIAVIWIGAILVFRGELNIGALIAFQMVAGRVTGPLVRMVGLIHEYQQIALSVRMLGCVMNSKMESDGGGVRQPLRGNISFEHVTFRYRPELPDVIKDLNLEIPAGSTVGIVGRSGSGKTTLTKLLQGLYPLQSGLIKLDGIDLREIAKSHLRSNIGVVLQDNYFFSGSVRQNIALTKPTATLEEIIYVSKLAGADEFVQTLQQGYDTMLEENASNLSGGQKQRLAIARALLTNPPMLIFDEATSALDPESETIIQDNLGAIAKGRTVLIISHRLSMVAGADKILVIDKGVKSAYATHKELLAQEGVYHDFWVRQVERHL